MEHKNRTAIGIIAVLLLMVFSWGYFGVLQSEGANVSSNSGLNGNVTLQSMYHVALGWNPVTAKWSTLSMSPQSDKAQVAITVPVNVTTVIVASGNSSLDAQHLFEMGVFYFNTNIAISGTATKTNGETNASLSSAYIMLGDLHNSTSTGALGDKSVTNVVSNDTLYSNTTNNLAKSQAFNLFNSFSNLGSEVMYVIHVTAGASNATNKYSTSLELTSSGEYPFKINIVSDYTYVEILVALLAMVLVTISLPRLSGSASYTFRKNEISGAILAAIAGGIIYFIADLGGAGLPFVSSSLPYTGILGFAVFVYIYGMQENKGSLFFQVLAGIFGIAASAVISSVFPFFGPVAGVVDYSFAGQVGGILIVLASILLAAGGFAALKHSRFDEHPGIF